MDWHLFDAEKGLEVRPSPKGKGFEVRDSKGTVTALTARQFNRLRKPGRNPKGLE